MVSLEFSVTSFIHVHVHANTPFVLSTLVQLSPLTNSAPALTYEKGKVCKTNSFDDVT